MHTGTSVNADAVVIPARILGQHRGVTPVSFPVHVPCAQGRPALGPGGCGPAMRQLRQCSQEPTLQSLRLRAGSAACVGQSASSRCWCCAVVVDGSPDRCYLGNAGWFRLVTRHATVQVLAIESIDAGCAARHSPAIIHNYAAAAVRSCMQVEAARRAELPTAASLAALNLSPKSLNSEAPITACRVSTYRTELNAST